MLDICFCSLFFVVRCSLFGVRCFLRIHGSSVVGNRALFLVMCCAMCVVHYVLCRVFCVKRVACCLLCVGCCLLFVEYCSLLVECCLLFVFVLFDVDWCLL